MNKKPEYFVYDEYWPPPILQREWEVGAQLAHVDNIMVDVTLKLASPLLGSFEFNHGTILFYIRFTGVDINDKQCDTGC